MGSPTIFSRVTSVLVKLTIEALVWSGGVPSYVVWPFKIWLILDLLQHPIYGLLKH